MNPQDQTTSSTETENGILPDSELPIIIAQKTKQQENREIFPAVVKSTQLEESSAAADGETEKKPANSDQISPQDEQEIADTAELISIIKHFALKKKQSWAIRLLVEIKGLKYGPPTRSERITKSRGIASLMKAVNNRKRHSANKLTDAEKPQV